MMMWKGNLYTKMFSTLYGQRLIF